MIKVFVEAGSETPRRMVRQVGCVMEWTNGSTRTALGKKEGTYNEAIIKTLLDVFKRMPYKTKIELHSKNAYVLNMISTNLPEWKRAGWKKKDGKPVASAELWQELEKHMKGHEVITFPGQHEYYKWMVDTMRRQDGNPEKNDKH